MRPAKKQIIKDYLRFCVRIDSIKAAEAFALGLFIGEAITLKQYNAIIKFTDKETKRRLALYDGSTDNCGV